MKKSKKIIVVAIMLLALVLPQLTAIGTVATVVAETGGVVDTSGWTELRSDNFSSIENGGSYILTEDITITKWYDIESGKTVSLDLNGYDIVMAETNRSSRFFNVYGTFSLYDTVGGGTIGGVMSGEEVVSYTANGGVYLNDTYAVFNMYGGKISNNTAVSNGGGVYVAKGTFNMSGGEISGNTATKNGGGVYIASSATFKLSGTASIYGNTAGGIASNLYDGTAATINITAPIYNGVTFEEFPSSASEIVAGNGYYLTDDVTLSSAIEVDSNKALSIDLMGKNIVMAENKSSRFFIVYGTFNLYDSVGEGAIGGVMSGEEVATYTANGGVYMNDTNAVFNMYGGKISNNTAVSNGGGVYVANGTFNMLGGEISGNSATKNGGGVYVSSNCTFVMSGDAKISGNTATLQGGGVYNCHEFIISDSVNISGNKVSESANNVFNESDDEISVAGLNSDATVGITVSSETGTYEVAISYDDYTITEADLDVFTADGGDGYKKLLNGDSGVVITNDENAHIIGNYIFEEIAADKLYKIRSGGNYYLTSDVELSAIVTIFEGSVTRLDLSGYKITASEDFSNRFFNIYGELNIYDSVGTGVIGYETLQEGEEVAKMHQNGAFGIDGGVLNFFGGAVYGNSAESKGGAVYVTNEGAFNMLGGTFSSNTGALGGAVYVDEFCTFTMSGDAKIAENTAEYGGGVYIKEEGTLAMNGSASISANIATVEGGGVYNSHNLEVSGSVVIYGNLLVKADGESTVTSANNVYNEEDDEIAVVGAMETGAKIGISNTASERVEKHLAVVIGTDEYAKLSWVTKEDSYVIEATDIKYFYADVEEGVEYCSDGTYANLKLTENSSSGVVDTNGETHTSVSLGNGSEIAQANGSTDIKLQVEEIEENDDTDAINMVISAKEESVSTVTFLDMKLQDYQNYDADNVESSLTDITDAGAVVEIIVDFDCSNKEDFQLYRYHDFGDGTETVQEFEALDARPVSDFKDARFFVDSENDKLYIYTQYFSTYAIGYNTVKTSSSSSTIKLDPTKINSYSADVEEEDVTEDVEDKTEVEISPSVTEAPVATQKPEVNTDPATNGGYAVWIILAVILLGVIGFAIYKKKKQ